jgi:Leucine-rich repeat (LRR) protein
VFEQLVNLVLLDGLLLSEKDRE